MPFLITNYECGYTSPKFVFGNSQFNGLGIFYWTLS